MSYLSNNKTDEPSCSLSDLISNSQDLILLTGNYHNFFGKLFYANKIKDFETIIKTLQIHFCDRIYFEIQRHNDENEKNSLEFSSIINGSLISSPDKFISTIPEF